MEADRTDLGKGRTIAAAVLGIGLAVAATVLGILLPHEDFGQRLLVAGVKSAAMVVFLGAAWLAWRESPAPRARPWILGGIAFEALCDFSIEFSVTAGGIAAALGMVAYSLAFSKFPSRRGLGTAAAWAAGLCLLFVAAAWTARTAAGQTFGSLDDVLYSVYMLILSSAVGMALSRDVPLGGRLAIALFYLSDYFVYFGGIWGRQPFLIAANSLTYYPAQILFAVGFFLEGKNKPQPGGWEGMTQRKPGLRRS